MHYIRLADAVLAPNLESPELTTAATVTEVEARSVLVTAQFNRNSSFRVTYYIVGTPVSEYSLTANYTNDDKSLHEVRIAGLEPNSPYVFQVQSLATADVNGAWSNIGDPINATTATEDVAPPPNGNVFTTPSNAQSTEQRQQFTVARADSRQVNRAWWRFSTTSNMDNVIINTGDFILGDSYTATIPSTGTYYAEVTTIPDDGSGQPDWSAQIQTIIQFEAVSVTPPVVVEGDNNSIHNHIGTISAPAYNNHPWESQTMVITGDLTDFHIKVPEGQSPRAIIRANDLNDVTIARGVIEGPDSWYFDARGAGVQNQPDASSMGIFLKNCNRPVVTEINCKNFHEAINSDTSRAPQITKILGMDIYRHLVFVSQCRTLNNEGMLVDQIFAYAPSDKSLRTGGSPDWVNIFRPIIHDINNPYDVRHKVNRIMSIGGASNNGSCVVNDASDWRPGSSVLLGGGVDFTNIAAIDYANKVTAIGGGAYNTMDGIWGYQSANSVVHSTMTADRDTCIYIADFLDTSQSVQHTPGFRGHRIRNVKINGKSKSGAQQGFWRGPSSTQYGFYGHDSDFFIDEETNVDVSNGSTTRAEVMQKIKEWGADIPAYDVYLDGRDENYWLTIND